MGPAEEVVYDQDPSSDCACGPNLFLYLVGVFAVFSVSDGVEREHISRV